MADVKRYGSTPDERELDRVNECRHIVKEVMTFGVDQRQILKLIELFSLELENRDHMQQISSLIKRLEKSDASRSTLITEI